MLEQIAQRRKAIVALIGSVATFVVAVAANTTAGHYAALVLALLSGAATHQVANKPTKKPRAVKKA